MAYYRPSAPRKSTVGLCSWRVNTERSSLPFLKYDIIDDVATILYVKNKNKGQTGSECSKHSGAFFSIIYCEWMLKGGVNEALIT